ncbi:MAG: AAA family ATPase, partial [Sandaracinaceae bacterium]|nr:AAA family ATPase [Sandaracinaceae bacterium]
MSLPPPPNRFVGRERELVEVESAFASGARLVSLLGPPGVGKSRLAQQFASRARGSAYCELESARTIEDLCFVVRRELGAEAEASEPDRVGELLRARGELVLVLDAFEHLVVLAADAVTRWVARAATLRVLVTSRVRLATPAERVIELGPLPLPKTAADLEHAHSVQLLLERARAVGAPLRLDEAERRAILTIVRALDGLPLAIELAAARMRVVSPAQLVAQLEQRLDALGGTRGRDRHATLRDAIAWSWESLRDEERVALAECSVFVGGFDLDAAAAVLTAGSVVDVLQALRDHSLLSLRAQPSGSRFWILETIRDFAIERVEPALLERAREAHARYFTELAETVDPLRVSVPLLGAEVDNLLAMQRRAAAALDATDPDPVLVHRVIVAALALDPLLDLSGPSAVPTHALDLAVQLAERAHVPPALRARALLARAEALRWAGRLDEAGADLETAIKISGDAGETSLVAIGQYRAGSTLLMRGQTDAAKACYEASLRAARASRSPALEGRSIYGLTTAEYLSAGQSGVADRFEEALGIARATGDRRTEGHCLGALAAIRAIEDREGEALRLADEASRVLREIENRRPQTSLHMVRGMIDLARGDAPRAREEELRALVLARELGSVAYAADALTNLARVDLCLDRLDDAR